MQLGNFCMSLAVKDIKVSREFYEKLGFTSLGFGDESQKWIVLQNGTTKIGLFEGFFENNILTAFTSTSWDNSATKWLADLNPMMIRKMTEEAKQYHQNDMDSMEEVNKQAKALLGIPHAVNNEFIPLHTKTNGNVNFYNLLIAHYTNRGYNIDEFLFMNKGRFRKINSSTIEVGNFIYSFNSLGQFESVVKK